MYGHLVCILNDSQVFPTLALLPLGRLDTQQMQGLAALAAQHGNGTLRLTPWQNVLITDIL
jgi:sulfite reductase beta subunit-like hemoprotein